MIISRGRRYVFVHIPKTGGTALALALEARATEDDILIGDTPGARARRARLRSLSPAGRLWKHSTIADIDGVVTRDELTSFLLFTLVRNPWDRAVSYYHWLRAQSFDHKAVQLARSSSFIRFLGHPATRAAFRRQPAGSYLRDREGIEQPALFIRIEHLEHDLAPLETHLGFGLLPLPRANTSARARDWRPYYTDLTARIVAEDCAEDIARFGYAFDPADAGAPSSAAAGRDPDHPCPPARQA